MKPPQRHRLFALWLLFGVCACVALLWGVGQLARDQWLWSQVLFWIPSLAVVPMALAGAVAAWRIRSTRARWGSALLAGLGALAAGAVVTRDIGWGASSARCAPDAVRVLHWNPRAPGARALECGRALPLESADVVVISNPGRMTYKEMASQWVPDGWHTYDSAAVSVVSRRRLEWMRVLTFASDLGRNAFWIASVRATNAAGQPLHIVVLDLPSSPLLPRRTVNEWVRESMALYPDLPPVDLVVGDVNNLPGCTLLEEFPATSPPPQARCSGWQCTFPRQFPLWHTDLMQSGSSWEFEHYQTLDLGIGLHRAQLGVLVPAR